MGIFKYYILSLFLLYAPISEATDSYKETQVHIFQDHARHQFFKYFLDEVLLLASANFGNFNINSLDCVSESECAKSENYNKVDILYAPSSDWDLKDFRKVEAPILSALLGLRLPVYSAVNRDKFKGVMTQQDFKQKVVSFNRHWKDYPILERHKFLVLPVDSFNGIYDTLKSGKADYTLRGVSEAFIEVINRREHLEVNTKNFIYYNYPVHLYIRKSEVRLYRAVLKGMKQMKEKRSNTFTKSFMSDHIILDETGSCTIHNLESKKSIKLDRCNLKMILNVVFRFVEKYRTNY